MGTWKAPWEDKGRDWGNVYKPTKAKIATKPPEGSREP